MMPDCANCHHPAEDHKIFTGPGYDEFCEACELCGCGCYDAPLDVDSAGEREPCDTDNHPNGRP